MKKNHDDIVKMNRDYYNQNTDAFIEGTMGADMSSIYEVFEKYIPEGAKILDLGFGSGRDTLHFLEKGYEVVSIDISEELVVRAKRILPNKVRLLDFHDLDYESEFDAIWACASLLHSTEEALKSVIRGCQRALKPGGTLYMSFKKGEGQIIRRSRIFLDMQPETLREIIGTIEGIVIKELRLTEDVRLDHDDEWINVICQHAGK